MLSCGKYSVKRLLLLPENDLSGSEGEDSIVFLENDWVIRRFSQFCCFLTIIRRMSERNAENEERAPRALFGQL